MNFKDLGFYMCGCSIDSLWRVPFYKLQALGITDIWFSAVWGLQQVNPITHTYEAGPAIHHSFILTEDVNPQTSLFSDSQMVDRFGWNSDAWDNQELNSKFMDHKSGVQTTTQIRSQLRVTFLWLQASDDRFPLFEIEQLTTAIM
jgi:hypothetical protein